jgi:DNA-binding PadR family transcriptional regulator
MSQPLEPPLAELLLRLVELDDGRFETFVPVVTGESSPEAELISRAGSGEQIPPSLTVELASRGYLDMHREAGKIIGKFTITERGREAAAQLRPAGSAPVDLSWPSVRPVLIEIHAVWVEEGAPMLGLNGTTFAERAGMTVGQLDPVLTALRGDGWIEYRDTFGPPLPMGIKPSAKGIRFLNGWPSGDSDEFAKELLSRLEERIETDPDMEKRDKWHRALASGGRDLVVEVAAALVSRQISGA